MADQLQLRRGTTAEMLLFTGAQGEVIVDTDKNTLVVQDGITAGGFPLATESSVANGTFYFNDDTGGGSAADAYLLTPKVNTNTPTAYLDGIQLGFVTANANTGPATADFSGLGVRNIKYADGSDPAPGDVFGRVNIVFDAVNDWFELQPSVSDEDTQVREISGTVAANALTITVNPCKVDFRSSVIGNGGVSSRTIDAPITLVVPAGATLGTTNGVLSKLAVIAVDTGSEAVVAVINTSGGTLLDESTLINTTAISAAASSATVFYSAAPLSGRPYRVMGFIESTQTIAGTWGALPSRVQGSGGQVLINSPEIALTKQFVSADQTMTAGGQLDITHSLGVRPTVIYVELVCIAADLNYGIGDRLTYPPVPTIPNDASSRGLYAVTDNTTSIKIGVGTGGLLLMNKTTRAVGSVTLASWRLVVRAFA